MGVIFRPVTLILGYRCNSIYNKRIRYTYTYVIYTCVCVNHDDDDDDGVVSHCNGLSRTFDRDLIK